MIPRTVRWPLAAALLVAAVGSVRAEDRSATPLAEPPAGTAVAADDALSHVGETCTIELVVRGGRRLADKNVCFLNSRKDHRADGTFTAVIFKAGLERLASDGIAEPDVHYLNATIRVHGLVEQRQGRAQIVVEEPGQIVVVEPATSP